MNLTSEEKHDLRNILASMEAQLMLLKREPEVEGLSEKFKANVSRFSEKIEALHKLLMKATS
jgi:hypothetical protein